MVAWTCEQGAVVKGAGIDCVYVCDLLAIPATAIFKRFPRQLAVPAILHHGSDNMPAIALHCSEYIFINTSFSHFNHSPPSRPIDFKDHRKHSVQVTSRGEDGQAFTSSNSMATSEPPLDEKSPLLPRHSQRTSRYGALEQHAFEPVPSMIGLGSQSDMATQQHAFKPVPTIIGFGSQSDMAAPVTTHTRRASLANTTLSVLAIAGIVWIVPNMALHNYERYSDHGLRTSGIDPEECWVLAGFAHVAVWLDVVTYAWGGAKLVQYLIKGYRRPVGIVCLAMGVALALAALGVQWWLWGLVPDGSWNSKDCGRGAGVKGCGIGECECV